MLAIGTDVLDNIHVSHKDRCRTIGAGRWLSKYLQTAKDALCAHRWHQSL